MAAKTVLEILYNATNNASGVINQVKKDNSKLAAGAKKAGKIIGTAAIGGGIALAGLGAASIKMALDFDKSIAEVQTLLPGLSEEGFQKLRADVLDFAKEMNVATTDAVPALYSAISAGVPPDNVIDFMRIATKAATGGVTDLETAVDGITSVVNAYGADIIDAAEASDIMFTAVRLGKTNFEQLSRSLFNVIPTASALGIGFEDIAASMAVMTAQGTPTSVATTQLRALLVEASKSGTKLNEAILAVTGEGFEELIAGGASVSSILDEVRTATEDSGGKFGDLFGSVEAMAAALATTGPKLEGFESALDEMTAAAGATDAAFDVMADTASFRLSKVINSLKIKMIEFGTAAMPLVEKGIAKATEAAEALSQWFDDNRVQITATLDAIGEAAKTMFGFFMSGLDVVLPLIQSFINFILDHKSAMILALLAIGAAVVLALGPVSLAALAIAGIIIAVGFVRDNWDEIMLAMGRAADRFKTEVSRIFQSIKNAITNPMDTAKRAIQGVIDLFNIVKNLNFSSIGSGLKSLIPGFADGTSFAPGGVSLVGERGPELVNLPRGSRVTPAGQTARMLGAGGGTTVIINNTFPNFVGDKRELAREIESVISDSARRGGGRVATSRSFG